MSYKVAKSAPLGDELKRVAASQIACAQETLAQRDGDVARTIHAARSRFKKTRSVLRVARRGLGGKSFERGNRLLRDAGRGIRAARDSVALIEALDALCRDCYGGHPPEILRSMRRMLSREAKLQVRDVKAFGTLARTERALRGELDYVEQWALDDFDKKDARKALRKARKAFLSAQQAAVDSPDDEHLHEWRKRAKILAHESLLLRKICPRSSRDQKKLELLARILGDERDLGLLAGAIKDRRERLGRPTQRKQVLALLARHRKSLCKSAFTLAAKF